MDLVIILLWFLAFSVIVLFLGTLNYILGRPDSNVITSEKKIQSDTTNQQQLVRSNNSSNRRKHARNANRKQRQEAAAATTNEDSNNDNIKSKQDIQPIISETKNDEDESLIESSTQPTDEEQEQKEEFKDPMTIEEVLISSSSSSSPPTSIQDTQEPILPIKQRNKNRSNHTNSKLTSPSYSNITHSSQSSTIPSKDEAFYPSKPQASVPPVKQTLPLNNNNNSSSLSKMYSYSGHNSLPPRFQQQNNKTDRQNFHKQKSITQTKKSSFSSNSITKQNDFIPSKSKQQINNNNHNQLELSQQEHDSSYYNGYSSESDILSESLSTINTTTNNHSSLLSPSNESQYSSKEFNLIHSLSKSNILLDELFSIFDTISFSPDQIQLLLNKIIAKHLLTKQDRQHLLSTTKNDKIIERILDETYRRQAKILEIDLQTEKNRVLELTKTNTELDNTIRQLQQTNIHMIPYQQTLVSYQMQIRKVTDENARLVHQLHAFSIMPGTINELKQQQHILNEQFRQLTIRNSTLEQEIADGERASKHAAEIYKRADNQKQERIEQMIADLNKYKKIDKDLSSLRQKHSELEKSLNTKLNDIKQQRDDLQKTCDELKEKADEYDELKQKYDQLIHNQNEDSNINELQQELNEVKAKNDLLKQRNAKIIEQLNKTSHEQTNQLS